MPICHGNGEHCCWVDNEPCRFLEEYTVEGRHWVCGLYRELQDWDKVAKDPRYLEHVHPAWEKAGIGHMSCGSWPQEHFDEISNEQRCCWKDVKLEDA